MLAVLSWHSTKPWQSTCRLVWILVTAWAGERVGHFYILKTHVLNNNRKNSTTRGKILIRIFPVKLDNSELQSRFACFSGNRNSLDLFLCTWYLYSCVSSACVINFTVSREPVQISATAGINTEIILRYPSELPWKGCFDSVFDFTQIYRIFIACLRVLFSGACAWWMTYYFAPATYWSDY